MVVVMTVDATRLFLVGWYANSLPMYNVKNRLLQSQLVLAIINYCKPLTSASCELNHSQNDHNTKVSGLQIGLKAKHEPGQKSVGCKQV